MSKTFEIDGVSYSFWTCRTCGCPSTVPKELEDQFRKSGGYRHCPNGHAWGWSKEKTEDERVRLERDRLKQQLAERDDDIRRQRELRELAKRQASAARGQVTKIKNRVGRGACPCCNRSFDNLHRHMAAKHPTFIAEAVQ